MIIKNANLLSKIKFCLFIATSAFAFTQCAEDEVIAPSVPNETATTANLSTQEEVPFSLNISGIHSFSTSEVTCKTCKYIVASNVSVIDGEKLGIKAGDLICLDAALKYGSLEFINLNGTIEKPVVIANCDSRKN
jgi:hypothetical protein